MNIAALYPIRPRFHDPNVSLIANDQVVFAYEEEKISRRPKEPTGQGYPAMALYAALNKAGLRPDQIDLWALVGATDDVFADFTALLQHTQIIHFVPDLRINRVPRHLAHAALSVFTSPFEECLFVSMDKGDDGCAVLGTFRRNRFQEIYRTVGFHLASFWSDMSRFLGFRLFEEEKLMGLGAYGHPDERLYRQLKSILHVNEDGLGIVYRRPERVMHQDLSCFNLDDFSLLNATFPRFHFNSIPCISEISKPDIAATVQKLTEDCVMEVVAGLVKRTGVNQLALSGALFQNAKLNSALHGLPQVSEIHVPMALGDSGLSLGAALYTMWEKTGKRTTQVPLCPYLGPVFENQAIEREIKSFGLRYRHSANISKDTARLISEGRVVGWFQEAGEYGPRSLGARSVLADPRDARVKARINDLLEDRNRFGPHAVSILEEYAGEFFHHSCKTPYMSLALKVRSEKASLIPAAVHVDGTSIPQTVSASQNRRYYRMIQEFHSITGLPLVLNADFHRLGVPAVCTPKQALEHLCMGCVDILAMGDFLVERQFLPKEETMDAGAEARMVASLKIMPIVDLARAGKTEKAIEACERLGLPENDGAAALIKALSGSPEKRAFTTRLMEHLTSRIEERGKEWPDLPVQAGIRGASRS